MLLILASRGAADTVDAPRVRVETNLGNFEITLEPGKAPLSVAHFLKLVDEKRYDGTIFHRVIPGFMVQGGGKWPDLTDIEEAATDDKAEDNQSSCTVASVAIGAT